MDSTCDPETQSCPEPDQSQSPAPAPAPAADAGQNQSYPCPQVSVQSDAPASGEAHEPGESSEKKSTGEEVVSTAHLATEGVEVAAEMAKNAGKIGPGLGTTASVVGSGIAIGETIHDAVTGEGCAGDKAMGIVPLMGPLSMLMMPSWCGPGPAESKHPDTGMTPSQEKQAGYMTPAQ